MEYIINGEQYDAANLYETVKKIAAIRSVGNFACIMTDHEKRKQAEELAEITFGWTNVRPLIAAMKYVYLYMWSYAEGLADVKAQSPYQKREKIENIVEMRQLYQEIIKKQECVTLRQLAVGGRELMDLGMKPGRELGSMLSELLEYVLDDPARNDKEILCAYVKNKLNL